MAHPPVTHDLMLRALRGESVERTPVWAMRQAGRYLPEFRALRAQAEFFEVCNEPSLCAEATLQPLRRYPGSLDAVVVFSDILIVPQALGMEVRMEPGPVFPSPLTGPEDLARLTLHPDAATVFAPLYAGISLTRAMAAAPVAEGGCGKAVPVIGFCGAPWTLMSYMVGVAGRPSPQPPLGTPGTPSAKKDAGPERIRAWLYQHPQASHTLLKALTQVCIDLLVGCWEAGASVLQVFDSGAGDLPPSAFHQFSLPYLEAVGKGVKARVPPLSQGGPALIVFPRGQHSVGGLEHWCGGVARGYYDAIGLDWGWDPREATHRALAAAAGAGAGAGAVQTPPLPPPAFQGNLDPALLFAPRPVLLKGVRDMLVGFWAGGKGTGLVCNLGHGMLPGHDPEALGEFFAGVGAISRRLREAGEGGVGDDWIEGVLVHSLVVEGKEAPVRTPESLQPMNQALAARKAAAAAVASP